MKKYTFISFFILGALILLWGCQEEISVDLPPPPPEIIVEGFIENDSIPIVILTRNQAYFSAFNFNDLSEFFVRGAEVKVSTGTDTIQLQEINIPISDSLDFYAYTDPTFSFLGEEGKTYSLSIKVEGKELKAVTTIPNIVPINKITFNKIADSDTLRGMVVEITDPDTIGNFYRIFTKLPSDDLFLPSWNSVGDDQITNGKTIPVPVAKGEPRDIEVDINTFGLFTVGDTATLKLCSIDSRHYYFWLTLEQQLGQQGSPFASPTEIKTNIEGGLGFWGGYGAVYQTVIVEE